MPKVWRYDLAPAEGFAEWGHMPGEPGSGYAARVEMPVDAQILSFNFSTKGVSIYALTDLPEDSEKVVRDFYVAGNDHELPDGANALTWRGTAKVFGGPTAHVFELTGVQAAS